MKRYLVNDGEDPRFALLSTVGTDTEVDLPGVGVGLVGSSQGENDISRCARNVLKDRSYSFNATIEGLLIFSGVPLCKTQGPSVKLTVVVPFFPEVGVVIVCVFGGVSCCAVSCYVKELTHDVNV
jgi:hypothetical protein